MGMEKVQIIKSMIETTANPIPQFVDSYKVNDETKSNRFSGLKSFFTSKQSKNTVVMLRNVKVALEFNS
jgi:hypothetical protein